MIHTHISPYQHLVHNYQASSDYRNHLQAMNLNYLRNSTALNKNNKIMRDKQPLYSDQTFNEKILNGSSEI